MNKIFYPINAASELTGLSRFFLRSGCRNGTIPHIMCGNKYLIDVPSLLEKRRADVLTDNTRLLLHAVSDALEAGASPQALAFFGQAAEALANGDTEQYLACFTAGEQHARI